MSVAPEERETPATLLASWLAVLAVTAAAIGVVYKPVRVIPAAMVLALVAAAIGGPARRLAALAVGVTSLAFVVGMTVAVVTENPLW